ALGVGEPECGYREKRFSGEAGRDRLGNLHKRPRSGMRIQKLFERQLFGKEEVLRSQGATGMRRKENQAEQIHNDRRNCSEAVCNGSDQRKAWHDLRSTGCRKGISLGRFSSSRESSD